MINIDIFRYHGRHDHDTMPHGTPFINDSEGDNVSELSTTRFTEVLFGDETIAADVESLINGNLESARAQQERLRSAEVVIFVCDCPDVRVDFPSSERIQEILSQALGKKVAVVGLGAFGGGFDVTQLAPYKAQFEAEGKEVLVLEMAHAKNDEGTEGCGALGAFGAIKSGSATLPTVLREMVENCIAGVGSQHHQSLIERLTQSGLEGITLLNNHAARHFVINETRFTSSPLAKKLADFFSTPSEQLSEMEKLVGMDQHVDVSHQDAPYGVVEIGPLFRLGGTPVLMDGGDRANWRDSFIVTTLDTSYDKILHTMASQIYPRIARAHHDFVSMRALVVAASEEVKPLVLKAIEEIKTEIDAFNTQVDDHSKIAFFENIVFVSSGSLEQAVA